MSIEATLATWKLDKKTVTPTEKYFLLSCANRAGESHECWPSIRRLVEDTGFNRKTVIKIRQSVINKGLMEYSGELKGRSGQIPVMRLTYVDEFESKFTSPKSGTSTSPKSGTGDQSQNRDTESKRENLKGEVINPLTPLQGESKEKDILSLDDLKADNPHQIPDQLLKDWMTNRKNKRTPITPTAWQRLQTTLAKINTEKNIPPHEAFAEMVASGWQSLKSSYFNDRKSKADINNNAMDYELGQRSEFGF